ncbi:MAG: AI-2E family transporter [Candidatus Woesearchaeota archaeon]
MKKFHIYFGLSILALTLLGVLIFKYWLITANIVGGFLLYFLIDEFLGWLERRGIKGPAAYTVLALVCGVIITAFVLFVSIPIIEQAKAFIAQLPQIQEKLNTKVIELSETFPFLVDAQESIKNKIAAAGAKLFALSGDIVSSAISIVLIALILLASRQTLHQEFTEHIPNEYFEVVVGISHKIISHIQSYSVAKIIETTAMIILHSIGFWAIGLPQPLLFGMLAGILNIIPYLGPLFAAAPIGLAAFVAGGFPLLGLSLMVIFIAQLIDNAILQTVLISKFVNIHPLMVVLLTLIAGEVAGIIGMVVAIPVYVVAKITIRGIYEYWKSVERHEKILKAEAQYG